MLLNGSNFSFVPFYILCKLSHIWSSVSRLRPSDNNLRHWNSSTKGHRFGQRIGAFSMEAFQTNWKSTPSNTFLVIIKSKPSLVLAMASHTAGDKPFSKSKMTKATYPVMSRWLMGQWNQRLSEFIIICIINMIKIVCLRWDNKFNRLTAISWTHSSGQWWVCIIWTVFSVRTTIHYEMIKISWKIISI